MREYGLQDITCLELGTTVRRRGRPLKQVNDYVIDGLPDDDFSESADEQEEPVQQTNVVRNEPSKNISDEKNSPSSLKMQKVVEKKETQEVKPSDDGSDDGFVDPMSLLN